MLTTSTSSNLGGLFPNVVDLNGLGSSLTFAMYPLCNWFSRRLRIANGSVKLSCRLSADQGCWHPLGFSGRWILLARKRCTGPSTSREAYAV